MDPGVHTGPKQRKLPHDALKFVMHPFDVILNNLSGFKANSYGIIEINFLGNISGRVSFYRSEENSPSDFQFAFAVPLRDALRGQTAVGFNTFQPSSNPLDYNLPVLQWLSIVNLNSSVSKKFTVRRYSQSGVQLSASTVSVEPLGRLDLEAGHINPGPNNVGMHVISPLDSTSPYLAQIVRYGTKDPAASNFAFAFPLNAQAGSSSAQWVPISSGAGGLNWVEVLNVTNAKVNIEALLFNNSGAEIGKEFFTLNGYAQRHINASALLGPGESGAIRVRPVSSGGIIAQSMFYFFNSSGSVQAMYGSQSSIPLVGEKIGSYNLFLGMYNWLRVFNVSEITETIQVQVYGANGTPHSVTLLLPPHSGRDLGLHELETYGTDSNSYGLVEVTGPALSEILRIKPDSLGLVDFATPTSVE